MKSILIIFMVLVFLSVLGSAFKNSRSAFKNSLHLMGSNRRGQPENAECQWLSSLGRNECEEGLHCSLVGLSGKCTFHEQSFAQFIKGCLPQDFHSRIQTITESAEEFKAERTAIIHSVNEGGDYAADKLQKFKDFFTSHIKPLYDEIKVNVLRAVGHIKKWSKYLSIGIEISSTIAWFVGSASLNYAFSLSTDDASYLFGEYCHGNAFNVGASLDIALIVSVSNSGIETKGGSESSKMRAISLEIPLIHHIEMEGGLSKDEHGKPIGVSLGIAIGAAVKAFPVTVTDLECKAKRFT